MKLEDQVTSLELSKKLKELGVKQESYWYWIKPTEDHWNYTAIIGSAKWELTPFDLGIDSDDEGHEWTVRDECKRNNPEFYETYSAFTVTELGKLLPAVIFKEELQE